eukprot:g8980.t1
MLNFTKYFALSTLASVAVVYHAFYTREQYFPSFVYLSTSKLAVAILGNMVFACALCFYRLIIKIFLGRLRDSETERLNERVSSAIMETCLAMTIFREEFNVIFVAMFAVATFVKIFHWLVQDRVDYMETTPNIPRTQHLRITSFMMLLLIVDILFLNFTVFKVIQSRGKTVMLLFAFEYLIQIASVFSSIGKYSFAALDSIVQGHWESKGVYVFYLELMTDLFHLCVYLVFFCIVLTQYGLPIHLIRDLYWTIRNFKNRVRDFLRYRRVISRMDLFPDATEEDLARCDNVCIICREEMTMNTVNKKLPCGHVFHVHCLRSWLERQQNCPTCRAPVFPPRQTTTNTRQSPPNAQNARQEVQQNQPNVQERNLPEDLLQNINHHQQQDQDAGVQEQTPGTSVNNTESLLNQDQPQPPPQLPHWANGQQFGFVWNYPNLQPTTSMAIFANGQIQYAGQQNPEPVMNRGQQGLHGVVPIMSMLPSFSAPITLLAPPGTTPERHQVTAAAAVAAAAYTPHAGLVMMPPVTYIPNSNVGGQGGGGTSVQETSTSAAQAAAAASAASGMAAAFSRSQSGGNVGEQGSMDATMQILQRQLEFLHAQMTANETRTQTNNESSPETGASASVTPTTFPMNQVQDNSDRTSEVLQDPPGGSGSDPSSSIEGLRRRRIERMERQEDSEQ